MLDPNPTTRTPVTLTLYLLRHGQTESSRDNVFCGSTDPELTADGLAMAQAFAAAYRSLPWAAVFASPMRRTVATARALCDAIGTEPQLRDGLKEIDYGRWEGKSAEAVDREFHDDYLRWTADPAWYPPTGGEPAVSIAARAIHVVEEIRQRYAGGNVLVVSHKATIRIVLCNLLGIDVGRFRYRLGCPVASINVVEFGTHGPLVKALGERSHLDARLRALPGT
jgi:broad specificity phosphatase PhoE